MSSRMVQTSTKKCSVNPREFVYHWYWYEFVVDEDGQKTRESTDAVMEMMKSMSNV